MINSGRNGKAYGPKIMFFSLRLVYYVAATMDGYIATQQHKLDWLESFTLGDDATPYDDFYQTIGAVVMGAETYSWIMSNSVDDWPYQNVPAFVVTSRDLPVPPSLDITLLFRSSSAQALPYSPSAITLA
jgi:dihydrofolate reductase